MSKDPNGNFQTHIPEPRWQQVVSVMVVVLFILLVIWASRH